MRRERVGRPRPEGVRFRVPQLIRGETDRLWGKSENRLKNETHLLLNLCCRLAFSDAPVSRVVEVFQEVQNTILLPGQLLVGSVAESCCLRAFAAVQFKLGAECADFDWRDLDRVDELGPKLRDVPVAAVVGRAGQVESFDLMLWLLVSAHSDGVRPPYLTARAIANMDFYGMERATSFIEAMEDLAQVYEDIPDARESTASDINRAIAEFSTEYQVAWGGSDVITRPT